MLKLFVIFVTFILPCIIFDDGIWQMERMENLCVRLVLKQSLVLDKI